LPNCTATAHLFASPACEQRCKDKSINPSINTLKMA
jgi:hypothetical protein